MQPRYGPVPQGVAFVILAFSLSWLCWLPLVAADRGIGVVPPSAEPFLQILGTFGPFIAAITIISRTSGYRGLATFLRQAVRWRAGIQWYAAALLAPFAIRLAVIALHLLKGGSYPGLFSAAEWLSVPGTFLVVLVIGGPTGEEFGWRGFLLQRLQPLLGQINASIAIGVIGSLWHIPLFLIAGTAQSHLPYAIFVIRTIALSIISTWLYNGTRRSVLFVLLFHASLNTWPNTLYLLEADGILGPYISSTVIYVGWAIQLCLLGRLRGSGDRRQREEPAPELAA